MGNEGRKYPYFIIKFKATSYTGTEFNNRHDEKITALSFYFQSCTVFEK